MRKSIVCIGILASFLGGSVFAADSTTGLPVMKGKEVIATVQEIPIFMEEYNEALSSLHGHGEGEDSPKKIGKIDYDAPLKRLIDIRLVLLEAENIGLGDLPEIQEQIKSYSRQGMRQLLLEKVGKDVRPDEKAVDSFYKKVITQYVLQSLKFGKEEDAKAVAAEIKAGKNFDMVAGKAIGAKKAEGNLEPEAHKPTEMLQEIGATLVKMKKGEVSPIVPIQGGFVLMKLNDLRYPEDSGTRKKIEEEFKKEGQRAAQVKYVRGLLAKYTKVDEKLLKSIDYEAKEPGIENMLDDKRVLATIKGEEPVTVGVLAGELKKKIFHGTEKLAGTGKLNKNKVAALDSLLATRVMAKEALAQGIDKTAVFKNSVEEFRKSMLFGAFMTKVIIPNMKIEEDDISQYYKEHTEEFASPAMVRLNSMIFSAKGDAENVLAKLRKGTDFKWLATNEAGQVDENSEGVLPFDRKLLMVTLLPEQLQKQLAGAGKGDMKLYADGKGHFYVLQVEDLVAGTTTELSEVHDAIKEKIFKVKLQQDFDEMTKKLRDVYPVKTYVDRLESPDVKK